MTGPGCRRAAIDGTARHVVVRRGSPARDRDPGPGGRVRRPARRCSSSLIEARQLDVLTVPARRARRGLPRRARHARGRPARQRQRVRRRREPAHPDQEPGDAAAAAGRRRRRPPDEAPDPEAELRARLHPVPRPPRRRARAWPRPRGRAIGLFRREPSAAQPRALAGARPSGRTAARPARSSSMRSTAWSGSPRRPSRRPRSCLGRSR